MNETTGGSTQPTPPPPPSGAPVIQSQGGAPKPVYKKPWFIAMIAVFLAIFVFVGISGSEDNTGTTSSAPTPEPEIVLTPSVSGSRLDVAYSDFNAVGVDESDIEIVGGGTFGIVDESGWTVCEQQPAPDAPLEAPFRFIVDRNCPDTGAVSDESIVETDSDAAMPQETSESESVPDSPILFKASVSGDIDDMRKDLSDLEVAIAEDGVLRILGNITEISFNYAQLGSQTAPEIIAEPWNVEMTSLEKSVNKLTDVVTNDGTNKQANSAIKKIRGNLDSLETLVAELN